MQLSSSGFSGGSAIPRRFTCDGEDLSPPFDWEAVPPTARSFAFLCDDPDAPAGKWHLWRSGRRVIPVERSYEHPKFGLS